MRKISALPSLIVFAWAAALCAVVAAGQDKPIEELAGLYDYDDAAAFELSKELLEEDDFSEIYKAEFASPLGGRMPCILVVPKSEGPHAGVVFGHWGNGTYEEFVGEARLYARGGAVSILITYPYERGGDSFRPHSGYTQAEMENRLDTHTVVDIRRSFDLMVAELGVDAGRIAYVGHSIGARYGGIVSAVDERVKTAILMCGAPDNASMLLECDHPVFILYRRNMKRSDIVAYVEGTRDYDPIHYVGHAAPTELLFQFAKYEEYFSAEAMQLYYDAASEPKEIRWYKADHSFGDGDGLEDRAEWLRERLGLKSVS